MSTFNRRLWLPMAGLALAMLACALPIGAGSSALSVTIQSPADGASLPVNVPVTISSVASDPNGPGVARVELRVNGQPVDESESPGGPQAGFSAAQVWTPTAEGEATIMVIAYREDGTASPPAVITVMVVGMTTTVAPASSTEATATPAYVQGRVDILANIRSGPGPLCPIIGEAPEGAIINLMEYSRDKLWYETDYLGPDEIGWIYIEPVTPLGDTSLIPVSNKTGCAGCGDGSCGADENCQICPQDCGQCCGNGACDFGETCATCPGDCGSCCGNGACDYGETCSTCPNDCGSCCGNRVCDAGETCSTCPRDCGPCLYCGDRICSPSIGENCYTCSLDCGPC
jgi:hypothetical protein